MILRPPSGGHTLCLEMEIDGRSISHWNSIHIKDRSASSRRPCHSVTNEYKDFINTPRERQRLGQTPGMHLEKQEDLWSREGRGEEKRWMERCVRRRTRGRKVTVSAFGAELNMRKKCCDIIQYGAMGRDPLSTEGRPHQEQLLCSSTLMKQTQ